MVKIPFDILKSLYIDSLKLTALINGGVDDWPWYGESLEEYYNDMCAEKNLPVDRYDYNWEMLATVCMFEDKLITEQDLEEE